MRIAVISPHAQNNGNTTLAMLIGMQFATTNKLTCMTHILPQSNSFPKYLNFKGFVDKTSSPSQIVQILKNGSLSASDVRDYCRPVSTDLEAFTNDTSNFSKEDMMFMFKYIAKAFPHDNVIFDVDDDNLDTCSAVIELCDVVVLNITQSVTELSNFHDKRDEFLKLFEGKPVVVVVNKYNSVKQNFKGMAALMGLKKPTNWVALHENPWITWATNHGKLNILFKNIVKKDPRVIDVNADLQKICKTLTTAKAEHDKKGRKS